MRTDDEILKMIRKLYDTKTDPTGQQRRQLYHKLSWTRAEKLTEARLRNEEFKAQFEKTNSRDERFLEEEVKERLDQLFCHVSDDDIVATHTILQIILVLLWLLGKKREDSFMWLHRRLGWSNMNHREIGRRLCDDMQISWKRLELMYP